MSPSISIQIGVFPQEAATLLSGLCGAPGPHTTALQSQKTMPECLASCANTPICMDMLGLIGPYTERMEALRDRVIEKIPLEAMKGAIQPIPYAALLQQYEGIEQRLRRTKELPALDKHKPGDRASSQGGGSQQHAKPKGQHAKDHNKRSSSSASQDSKPARIKPEGGDSGGKQKKPLSEIQCYGCKHALKRGTQWVDGDSHRACSHCTTRKQLCTALTNHHIELLSTCQWRFKFWAGCDRQQVLGRFILFYYLLLYIAEYAIPSTFQHM